MDIYKQIIKKFNLILSFYILLKKVVSDTFFSQKIFRSLDNSRLAAASQLLCLKDMNNKKNNNPGKKLDKKFLQWFVGFTDSEGTFLIQTKNNKSCCPLGAALLQVKLQ